MTIGSRTNQYFHPATPADGQCDHCHGPVNLTLLPAVEYDRLGPDGPLDLIRAAAEEREHENRMLAADERSAAAHERSAELQERACAPPSARTSCAPSNSGSTAT
jgi:hypothetical protein